MKRNLVNLCILVVFAFFGCMIPAKGGGALPPKSPKERVHIDERNNSAVLRNDDTEHAILVTVSIEVTSNMGKPQKQQIVRAVPPGGETILGTIHDSLPTFTNSTFFKYSIVGARF